YQTASASPGGADQRNLPERLLRRLCRDVPTSAELPAAACVRKCGKGRGHKGCLRGYRAFAHIIELASSSRHIKLPRGAGAAMGKMDYVGDLAAHHPTYTTRQKDIDEQRLAFHRVISELAHLADIKSQAAAG
ncbi:MAG: hypothetical protein ACXU87_22390, partial [Xanthobacteraceae bacterium]